MRHLFKFFHLDSNDDSLTVGRISIELDWITVVHSQHRPEFYQDDELKEKSVIVVEAPGEVETLNYCVEGSVEQIHQLLDFNNKCLTVRDTITHPKTVIRLNLI
jgi:hypothetical protein